MNNTTPNKPSCKTYTIPRQVVSFEENEAFPVLNKDYKEAIKGGKHVCVCISKEGDQYTFTTIAMSGSKLKIKNFLDTEYTVEEYTEIDIIIEEEEEEDRGKWDQFQRHLNTNYTGPNLSKIFQTDKRRILLAVHYDKMRRILFMDIAKATKRTGVKENVAIINQRWGDTM